VCVCVCVCVLDRREIAVAVTFPRFTVHSLALLVFSFAPTERSWLATSCVKMSTSADRLAANIARVENNYRVGVTADGTEYFVRTTSMRVRTEWSKLRVGDAISFCVRYAAGRGIISDVIAVRND
jgi:hypothetical protein